MKIIITVLAVLTGLIGLQGCEEGEKKYPPPPPAQSQPEKVEEPELKMSYGLPNGWEWMDEESRIAIWDNEAKGGNAPFVKLEPMGFPDGTEEDAKNRVLETYQWWENACAAQEATQEECDIDPRYVELDIAGTTVYAAMGLGYYWGNPSWDSSISFVKNGSVVSFSLGDRADLYTDELETVITTLNW